MSFGARERLLRGFSNERGEVASWLILAAGLAIAASFAAYGLGLITVGLTNDVADAAQVDVHVVSPIEAPSVSGSEGGADEGDPDIGDPGLGDPDIGDPGLGDPGDGAPGPGDGSPPSSQPDPDPDDVGGPPSDDPGDGAPGPGDGSPPSSDPDPGGGDDDEPYDPTTDIELLEWWASLTRQEQAQFCLLSPSLCDLPPPPRDPSDPVPACFDVENADTWYSCAPPCREDIHYSICWTDTGCFQSGLNHCADDGTCTSFHDLGCSDNPAVHEAVAKGEHYEYCAVEEPHIILCNNYPRGIEAGVAWYLRAEVGADPGDVFLMAAEVCAQGHPGCEFALDFANWYHDNRQWVLAAILAGDLLPAPPGVKCVVAGVDGFSKGDAAECVFGLATGLDVPIPSGAIDDALEGD